MGKVFQLQTLFVLGSLVWEKGIDLSQIQDTFVKCEFVKCEHVAFSFLNELR